MPRFIDPSGQPTFGLGICARCSRKFPLAALHPDPNYPALMVCDVSAEIAQLARIEVDPVA